LLPFGILGLRRERAIWLYAATFVSLVGAYSFYWIGSWLFGPRYYFEAVPAMVLLSAGGFGWLGGWLGSGKNNRRWRKPVSLGLLSMLMAANIIYYLPLRVGGMQGLYQIERKSAARFVVDEPGRTLIVVRAPHWSQYARYLYQVEPFSDSPLLIAWSRGDEIDQALEKAYKNREIYYFAVEADE
jgi:hypothetical protein